MSFLGFIILVQPGRQPGGQFLAADRHRGDLLLSGLHAHAEAEEAAGADAGDLQTGSEVVTTGGIVGTIVSITGDMLILRVKPDNIKLQISRAPCASLVKQESALEEKK